jgi:hypothetical protein
MIEAEISSWGLLTLQADDALELFALRQWHKEFSGDGENIFIENKLKCEFSIKQIAEELLKDKKLFDAWVRDKNDLDVRDISKRKINEWLKEQHKNKGGIFKNDEYWIPRNEIFKALDEGEFKPDIKTV